MDRLDESTCNFLAVARMARELEESGFKRLDPAAEWKITPGRGYFMTRNDSALFAFVAGEPGGAFRIVSAHSDSPCFKLKPNPEIYGDGGVVSLNVEKYGGGIMYTWFDRPLSISGRVALDSGDPLHPEMRLVDFKRPLAVIPHLAIHFNRAVNEGNPLSVQKDMKPVLGIWERDAFEACLEKGGVIKCLVAEELQVEPERILSMELCLYPFAKARLAGAHYEYLESARIDDLSMAFCGLEALLRYYGREDKAAHQSLFSSKRDLYDPRPTNVLAIFDNEETGSGTRQGAASPVLCNLLERLSDGREDFFRRLERSFMISADDAHAWHPNYNEKYDPTNHPVIGGGPVVKINANCKYMTDSRGDAVFRALCAEAGVKCQYFVNHADVAGGSTLGNILTSQLDIAGVDMGCAIWAMHSAAETGGVSDLNDTVKVFSTFYRS